MNGKIPRDIEKWRAAFDQGVMAWDWALWEHLLLNSAIILAWLGLWFFIVVIAISPRTFSRWAGGYPVVRMRLVPAFMLLAWIVGILATPMLFMGGPVASYLYLNLNANVFFELQNFTTTYLNLLGILFI